MTICNGKTQLLVRNPINRYLINSPMLPQFKKNSDGSIELYYSDGLAVLDKESNWLPAPDGPIYVAIRLYWPKQVALNWSGQRRRRSAIGKDHTGTVTPLYS